MPKPNVRTRTVQFRVKDVTFWRANGTIIPRSSPLEQLLPHPQHHGWIIRRTANAARRFFHEACRSSWF
jgi:hypothetical protein